MELGGAGGVREIRCFGETEEEGGGIGGREGAAEEAEGVGGEERA